jgi:hypothetical protein
MATRPEDIPLSFDLNPVLVTRLARYFHVQWNEMTVAPLLDMTEWELLDVNGVGVKFVQQIKDFLAKYGWTLRPDPVITEEVYLWSGVRTRLQRFGRWVKDHPTQTVDDALHEFLVHENQR